jgi:hypothetical protein
MDGAVWGPIVEPFGYGVELPDGWETVSELTGAFLPNAVTISKGKLEDAAFEQARAVFDMGITHTRPTKAAIKSEVARRLREVGALVPKTRTIYKLHQRMEAMENE